MGQNVLSKILFGTYSGSLEWLAVDKKVSLRVSSPIFFSTIVL